MVDFPVSAESALFKRITIYIGGYFVSKEPAIIKTVLGSCISVCLYDNKNKFGGMNHFMLPEMKETELIDDYNNTRYGIFAMEVLINEIIKLGGKKENLTAKIFGGGHVLKNMTSNILQVPDKNIAFAKKFLSAEKIPIISEDIGGSTPRKVFFFNTENRILMKKLETATREFSVEQEIKYSKSLKTKLEEKSDITLF